MSQRKPEMASTVPWKDEVVEAKQRLETDMAALRMARDRCFANAARQLGETKVAVADACVKRTASLRTEIKRLEARIADIEAHAANDPELASAHASAREARKEAAEIYERDAQRRREAYDTERYFIKHGDLGGADNWMRFR